MNSQTYIFKKNIACKQLNSFKSDAILLQNEVNLFWYIGIKNLEGYCLITKKGDYLFVDQRYYFAIKKTFKFFSIVCFKNQKTLLQQILKLKIKSILIEADYLSVAQYDNLFFLFNQEKICLKKFVSRNMRIIKSDEEIEIMKESANIACNCIDYIKKQLKIGVTEIQIKNLILKY